MSEWWTYSLSDFLMFSSRSYYRLIEIYNAAIWPAQLLALAAGVAIIGCVVRPAPRTRTAALLLLAAAWGWVAWAYHLERYADINTAAPYFAVAFAVQALLLCRAASRPGAVAPAHTPHRLALGLLGLAVIVYPLLGLAASRDLREAEVFGIVPDPTVVATLGVLLAWRAHWTVWLIPVSWCLVSGATRMELRIGHAALLPLLAAVGVAAGLMAWRAARAINSTTNPRP